MTAAFDPSTAYKPQGEIHFDDGREARLLGYLQSLPDLSRTPAAVLGAIDEFGRKEAYLMNVGPYKGGITTDLIHERKPSVGVELGGYVGYSAVLFAGAMRDAHLANPDPRSPAPRYYSLERDPRFAEIIRSVVALAGLEDVVEVVLGPSAESLRRLHVEGVLGGKLDFLFLDHWKPAYITDLKVAEELGLVKEGTLVVADNVVKPGNPPYLAYVRSSVQDKVKVFREVCEGEEREEREEGKEGEAVKAGDFPDRTRYQYIRSVGTETLDTRVKGNPWLVYESKLVESWEPTGVPDGVEVTRCVAEVPLEERGGRGERFGGVLSLFGRGGFGGDVVGLES